MPQFKLVFSGDIRKVEIRNAGGKQIAEVQICRKNYSKDGEQPTFTWIKATIWEPKPWQLDCLQVGSYISGIGEFTLRSYEKDGQKRQAAEVRVNSMDLDVPKPATTEAPAPMPAPAPKTPKQHNASSSSAGSYDEPPFLRYDGADVWG